MLSGVYGAMQIGWMCGWYAIDRSCGAVMTEVWNDPSSPLAFLWILILATVLCVLFERKRQ